MSAIPNKNLVVKRPITLGALARKVLDHFVEQVNVFTDRFDGEYDERDIIFNLIQCDKDGLRAYRLDDMVWFRSKEIDLFLLFKAITNLYSRETLLELCREGRWIDNEDDDAFHLTPYSYHNTNYDAILIEGICHFIAQ